MRGNGSTLTVRGRTLMHATGTLLVLSERLVGYDTFISGTLEIGQLSFPVRILTLDEMTVLHPVSASDGLVVSGSWEGYLHLSHGLRLQDIPADLAAEAVRRRRDLASLDTAELRYALTFLREATTAEIRKGRISAIVNTLPCKIEHASNLLISVDVGGTLGSSVYPSLSSRLVAASPLEPSHARRILRGTLHSLPELSAAVLADVCRQIGVDTSSFTPAHVSRDFQPFPGAVECVRQLSYYGNVVTLSNVTALEVDSDRLHAIFSPWVVDHFPSCQTGFAKPDARAFYHVAEQLSSNVHSLIHIGDDWECDVLGPVEAGARAIYIAPKGGVAGTAAGSIPKRALLAESLRQAVTLVGRLSRRTRE